MKPTSKNEVINGIVKAYLAQKELNADIANSWEAFNGGDNEIPYSYDLSKGTWAGMRADLEEKGYKFTAGNITFADGHNAKCLIWDFSNAIEMADIGALPYYADGNPKENAETADGVLSALLAVSYGVGDGVSEKQFENLVKVVPTDIAIDANGFPVLEHDGKEITGQKKTTAVAKKSDLESYSTMKHRHTVTIKSGGDTPSVCRFTGYSSKNTPIDSIQDLLTLFASTDFVASGKDGVKGVGICGINIGTSVATITLLEDDGTDAVTYATAFVGTTTINDDVTED